MTKRWLFFKSFISPIYLFSHRPVPHDLGLDLGYRGQRVLRKNRVHGDVGRLDAITTVRLGEAVRAKVESCGDGPVGGNPGCKEINKLGGKRERWGESVSDGGQLTLVYQNRPRT